MGYWVQQSVVNCVFSRFHKWAPQPALCWYHDDAACGTWNSWFKCSPYVVSVSSGLCRHTARYNYGLSKCQAKWCLRGVFHFHSPFYSYIWGMLPSICLFSKHTRRAGKQPCQCPVESEKHSETYLFCKQQELLGALVLPPVCSRADGLWSSPSSSTMLGIFT